MHKLLIEDDEGKTVAVPLARDEITIGRQEGNTIRLTEQNVSRKHVRLFLRNTVLQIEDLGSYNGTKLNGSALSGVVVLKDGDVIVIGDYRLGIQEERSTQVAHASPAPAEVAQQIVPVDQAMEGQPTIPLSTLTLQAAFLEPPARLVVASRVLSGGEFILDRPSHVLGRTSENDIILNHKSISRHHARIAREGNRYIIVDLESANGVRVGGTEHDRVELKSGDVIELGEVKLRFVTGDGVVFDEPASWFRDKRKILVAASGGVLGLILVVAFVFSGGSKAPSLAAKAVPATTEPALPPPALPQVPAEPAAPQASVESLLADAKAAALAEKWDEASDAITKVTTLAPSLKEATELRNAIEAEKKNRERLAFLQQELTKKNFETVLDNAASFPEDSVYNASAQEARNGALSQFVATHLETAKNAFAAGHCEEVRHEADLVLRFDTKNKKAADVVRRCETVAKKPRSELAVADAAPKPAYRRPQVAPVARVPVAKASLPEPPRPDPAMNADPDKLIKDAQQAWFRGQYAVAIEAARKALRAKPNLINAYQIIAVCSCALHDADSAAKAFERLDDRNKQYVKSSCQKNGIAF